MSDIVTAGRTAARVSAMNGLARFGLAARGFVYLVSGQFPLTHWARLLLASITVLAPTLVEEVLGDAANMYTFALWGAFWLFLLRARTWRCRRNHIELLKCLRSLTLWCRIAPSAHPAQRPLQNAQRDLGGQP